MANKRQLQIEKMNETALNFSKAAAFVPERRLIINKIWTPPSKPPTAQCSTKVRAKESPYDLPSYRVPISNVFRKFKAAMVLEEEKHEQLIYDETLQHQKKKGAATKSAAQCGQPIAETTAGQ